MGNDDLGVEVCRRLSLANRQIVALWPEDPARIDELEQLKIGHVRGNAQRAALLSRAGVRVAQTLLAITNDDQFNLQVALAARDLNPEIRVVLRQFNRWLGRKITFALANSEAVSPETYSAATFAASCLNHAVYEALEFPRYTEDLIAFCKGSAAEFGVGGMTVAEIEHRRRWKVLSIDAERFPEASVTAPAASRLTIAARLKDAPEVRLRRVRPNSPLLQLRQYPTGWLHRLRQMRIDPILIGLSAVLVAALVGSTWYFHRLLGADFMQALGYVVMAATHTEFTLGRDAQAPRAALVVGMLLMISGVAIVGILLAYLTAAITRRSIEFAQGRHAMYGSGHIIVCGFGNVGSRIVSYLLDRDRRVAVIDRAPAPALTGEARAKGAHIMTADATSESALEMARVGRAAALLAVTDSDSANLEIALTALAYVPEMPIILRISDPAMARAVERHFNIRASYSAVALAAPLVAGLAMERGSRGTVDVAGQQFGLVQQPAGQPPAADEIVLARQSEFQLVLRKTPIPAAAS